MAYISLYSLEGFIGNILLLYNLLECPTLPLLLILPISVTYEKFLFNLCSYVVILSSFQWCESFISAFPVLPTAHVFYTGLAGLLLKAFTLLVQIIYSLPIFKTFFFFFFLQTTVSDLWLLLIIISFSPTVKPLKLVNSTLRSNFI